MYRGLKFKAFSITGVNESKTHIKNYQVERFNEQMEAKISSSHLSNLEYVNILNGNDVNSIVVDEKKIDLTKYIQGDGISYNSIGYNYLWEVISDKI